MRRDKMGQNLMLNNIIDLWDRYKPSALILESNSVKWLREDVLWNQIDSMFNGRIVDQRTTTNKNDKLMGADSLGADVEAGRIRFPWADEKSRDTSRLLMDEMLAYPKGRTDDVFMALDVETPLWTV